MSEQNIELVKAVDNAFTSNEIEKFFELCDENVEWTMAGDRTVKGVPAIRKWMSEMPECEPPELRDRKMIADGDSVAAYGEMTMKTKDGASEVYDYCDVYKIADGKVTQLTSFVVKRRSSDAENKAAA